MAAGQLVYGAAGVPQRSTGAPLRPPSPALPGAAFDLCPLPGASARRTGRRHRGAQHTFSSGLSNCHRTAAAGAAALSRRPPLCGDRGCGPGLPLHAVRLRHRRARQGAGGSFRHPAALLRAGHGKAHPRRGRGGGDPIPGPQWRLCQHGQRHPAGLSGAAYKAGPRPGAGGACIGQEADQAGGGRGAACGLQPFSAEKTPGRGALHCREHRPHPVFESAAVLCRGQPRGRAAASAAGVGADQKPAGSDLAAPYPPEAPAQDGHGKRRSPRGPQYMRSLRPADKPRKQWEAGCQSGGIPPCQPQRGEKRLFRHFGGSACRRRAGGRRG